MTASFTSIKVEAERRASSRRSSRGERDPNNSEATSRLAPLVHEVGDIKRCHERLTRFRCSTQDYPEALFLKGVILLNIGSRSSALPAGSAAGERSRSWVGSRATAEQLLKKAQGQSG